MSVKIIKNSISAEELSGFAKDTFGDLVKVVVDIDQEIMAAGGELHADEEALLILYGSKQENLWGINIYPQKSKGEWILFDSLINIRPSQGNRSRSVESKELQDKIRKVVNKLVSE